MSNNLSLESWLKISGIPNVKKTIGVLEISLARKIVREGMDKLVLIDKKGKVLSDIRDSMAIGLVISYELANYILRQVGIFIKGQNEVVLPTKGVLSLQGEEVVYIKEE